MMTAMQRRRQILFAILFTILALVAVEFALRAAGYRGSAQQWLLAHSHARDLPLLVASGADFAVQPEARPWFGEQTFGPKKPGLRRVVLLGGSSLRGVGGEAAGETVRAFGEAFLDYGPVPEVLNLAGSGMTSRQLIWVAQSAARLKPDWVVLYTGHNDWTGARLYGDYAAPGGSDRRALLIRSRLYSLVRGAVLVARGEGDGAVQAPPGGPSTRAESEAVAADFTENLRAIIGTLHAAGAKVVLCDVVGNPLFPPAGCPLPPAYLARYQGRVLGATEDDIPLLADRLAAADHLGPAAELYREGLTAWRLGDRREAYRDLSRARDLDPTPLRADAAIRHATRDLAAAVDRFVDLEKLLAAKFVAGEPVGPLFVDNLHPSPAGLLWLAGHIVPAMTEPGP
jgi:lysophospholipase L1-like esterase